MVLVVVVVIAMSPMSAFAATANEKLLDNLKLDGLKKYDTDPPKNGKVISYAAWLKEFSACKYKDSTKGNTQLLYHLDMEFSNIPEYDYDTFEMIYGEKFTASKTKEWQSLIKKYPPRYTEKFYYTHKNSKLVKKTVCNLWTEDKTYLYKYRWIKGQKTGEKIVTKKKKGSSGFPGGVGAPGTPSKTKKPDMMKYPDEKVLGKNCFVWSMKTPVSGSNVIFYTSRSDGKQMQWLAYTDMAGMKVRNRTVNFAEYKLSKKASFYKAPKTVKFKKVKSFTIDN